MQASGMSEKAYFYPREGSTVFLSPDNVPTRAGHDMAALERPDMGKIGVGDDQAAGPQVGDDALHPQRVPQHRRVRH